MTAVYTAIAGSYDALKPHPEIKGVEWIAFMDEAPEDDMGWEVHHFDPSDNHPRDVAKTYKFFPHLFLPAYRHTIWIDGSHEVTSPDFVDMAVGAIGDADMALYRHPWRDCIYPEAEESLKLEKYQGQPIREQIDHYRPNHPDRWGLWATGTIARRNTEKMQAVMRAWAEETAKWSYQDQLSLPVVCRRLNYRPNEFPCHQVHGNPYCAIRSHNRED